MSRATYRQISLKPTRFLKTVFSNRIPIVLSLVLTVSIPTESAAEESPPLGYKIHRSIPPPGAKTHVVVPGERFRAGGFKRWLYGSDYRDLWATPIEVTVLDLDRVGGGLTPLRTGGAGQSISLHFTGQDGRRCTVRSLDKDPMKRKWDELKNTVVDDVLQDMISALLPTGARGRSANGSHRHPAPQAYARSYSR